VTPTTEEILVRLRLLEDEREITRTLYRYAQAQYNGDRSQFLDCFTDDAVIVRTRHGREVVGAAAIGEFFDAITHVPEAYHKHVVIEPVIEIAGDEAVVSSDFLYVQDRDGPMISHFGHYADVMARGPDGRWRFRRRELQTEAVSPRDVSTIRGEPGTPVGPTSGAPC
jgi:uncharacterized protein (TIGR02246 family)